MSFKWIPDFTRDCLNTLGQSMMEGRCWNNGKIIIGEVLHKSNDNPKGVWCWWDASGDFAASMFFCLKYLEAKEISDWLNSVFEISCPHWRAQFIVWLVGFKAIIDREIVQPSDMSGASYPDISWAWSHCLTSEISTKPFISDDNLNEAEKVIYQRVSVNSVLDWLESMKPYPYLESELGGLPDDLLKKYSLH